MPDDNFSTNLFDFSMDDFEPERTEYPDIFHLLNLEDISWHERALCAQIDPEMFFPEKGGSTRPAKKICAQCPVQQECLDYALDHDEEYGIWGGTSPSDRKKIKKKMTDM